MWRPLASLRGNLEERREQSNEGVTISKEEIEEAAWIQPKEIYVNQEALVRNLLFKRLWRQLKKTHERSTSKSEGQNGKHGTTSSKRISDLRHTQNRLGQPNRRYIYAQYKGFVTLQMETIPYQIQVAISQLRTGQALVGPYLRTIQRGSDKRLGHLQCIALRTHLLKHCPLFEHPGSYNQDDIDKVMLFMWAAQRKAVTNDENYNPEEPVVSVPPTNTKKGVLNEYMNFYVRSKKELGERKKADPRKTRKSRKARKGSHIVPETIHIPNRLYTVDGTPRRLPAAVNMRALRTTIPHVKQLRGSEMRSPGGRPEITGAKPAMLALLMSFLVPQWGCSYIHMCGWSS
ncbi:hypothetical protein EX30DRAFT_349247 [Ascodesmis nigricans]|uniref:Uncharacterized protein n=1 Tax=Ascodesmis nigricans TaxID=341454 RepID=A0A4S2MVR0_9PEZI|nr:hypothetical protein EX30DRAFT_349247 [Ascodesmis nigricans]